MGYDRIVTLKNKHQSTFGFVALSFNVLRYFNELKAQCVAFRLSGDKVKAQPIGNRKQNALQSLENRPVFW